MVKANGLDQRFFIGGFNISGDVGSIENASSPHAALEVTGINSSAIERVGGLSSGELSFAPWFNDAAGQAHLALRGLPTANVIALYATGAAIDDPAAGLVGKQVNYDWARGSDGSLQGTVQVLGSDGVPLEWMVMFTSGEDVQASAGTTASKNDGAATSNGLAAILEVVDIDSGTPTVTIEDSADNSAFATLKAFAAVADGTEPTAERVTVAGTVRQYLRLNITGTFSNLDYALAYRRGEETDDKVYA